MASEFTIEGSLRTISGKGYARKLRKNGKIPANLVGGGKSQPIEINPKLLPKAYKAGRKFNLSLGGKMQLVEVTDLQIDAVTRQPLHVDLKTLA